MEKWYGMAKRYWIRCRSLMVVHLPVSISGFLYMLMFSGIRFMYFTIFTFAYLQHTNKQDGAKEEVLLIIRCISEFVNEICTFDFNYILD